MINICFLRYFIPTHHKKSYNVFAFNINGITKMPRKYIKRDTTKPRIANADITIEKLPYPYVYYPKRWGLFMGFAKDEKSQVYFCSCSKKAMTNYEKMSGIDKYYKKSWMLTNSMKKSYGKSERCTRFKILFEDGLCHRCNKVSPTLLYCNYRGTSLFYQYHGWYIDQEFYRLGIYPQSFGYNNYGDFPITTEEIPKEIYDDYIKICKLNKKYIDYSDKYNAGDNNPYYNSELKNQIDRLGRKIRLKIHDNVKQDFNYSKVGEQWIHEDRLFKIILELFPDKKVKRHYKPEWLQGLILDIYIPDIKLAIEYNGQQHYNPIKLWGGDNALKNTQYRDEKKKKLCKANGIKLIIFNYKEKLTNEYVANNIIKAFKR